MRGVGKAVAHSNIALAKYWGKADAVRNLTAVPSLSLTLAALRTVTTVRFDDSLAQDELCLGGENVGGARCYGSASCWTASAHKSD